MIKVIVYLYQLHLKFFIKKLHLPFVFNGIFFLILKLRTTFRKFLYSEIVPIGNKFDTEWVQFQFSQLKRGETIPTGCVGTLEPLVGQMRNNWGNACSSIHRVSGCPIVLEFLEFLELFWIFFSTENILKKFHFFRLVLELFLNSKFLTISFLGYIFVCPLFGSSICDKILFQFCPRQP